MRASSTRKTCCRRSKVRFVVRRSELTRSDYRRAWEAEHAVTQEVVGGPPSRRANASFIACPVSDHLWLFGGEYFHSETRCEFYADLFVSRSPARIQLTLS